MAWGRAWPLRPLQLLPIPHPLIPFTRHTKPSHSSIRHRLLKRYWISPLYPAAQFRRNCSSISGLQGLWPMLQFSAPALPRLIWHDTALAWGLCLWLPPPCPETGRPAPTVLCLHWAGGIQSNFVEEKYLLVLHNNHRTKGNNLHWFHWLHSEKYCRWMNIKSWNLSYQLTSF